MGVPLQQCKQAYQYMTPVLRNHFAQQMADQNILDTYNFTNPGVTFKVFFIAFILSILLCLLCHDTRKCVLQL